MRFASRILRTLPRAGAVAAAAIATASPLVLSAAAPSSSKPAAPPTARVGGVDWALVYNDIAALLTDYNYDDGSYGPLFVRLAWHASGTYDKASGQGGSSECKLMRCKHSPRKSSTG
jgi:cytochrome c peroxidase